MTAPNRYAYRAARADGRIERGALAAESRDSARVALGARGLLPLELRLEADESGGGTRIPLRDLAIGFRILATLLDAGLPMTRALAAMPDLAPLSWGAMLPAVYQSVREGASLSAALDQSGLRLPQAVAGMLAAGDAGTGMAHSVRRAAGFLEDSATTRAAVWNALAYPAVLTVAGLLSMALLVGVVLPRFAGMLSDLGQTLPPVTRLVLTTANVARAAALPGTLTLLLAFGGWRAWIATAAGAQQWHCWLLGLPQIGAVRHSAGTARTCAAVAALLESGVPLAAALGHAARASGDAALGERLQTAREVIVTGGRPSAAFAETAALTPTACRLARAGEESGRLAEMLAHAATLEHERATQLVRNAVRLLEPGLVLVFGGLVAVVAAALLQAIYSVRPV